MASTSSENQNCPAFLRLSLSTNAEPETKAFTLLGKVITVKVTSIDVNKSESNLVPAGDHGTRASHQVYSTDSAIKSDGSNNLNGVSISSYPSVLKISDAEETSKPTSDRETSVKKTKNSRENQKNRALNIKRKSTKPVKNNSRAKKPRQSNVHRRDMTVSPTAWPYQKELTGSDVNGSCRCLLSKEFVRNHVIPFMNENQARDCQTKEGTKVNVRDEDEGTDHQLMLKVWSTNSFVLTKWRGEFVRRRNLKANDVVGLRWDGSSFHFKLLKKA
ncbi:hypothetical protein Salat_0993900 [Sesamum alatum]|uniref:TF-B3 domain-containing protein n=1 Tax=Sesamum alatum TaxID=300844 RepID=A0AAE2CS10_9LAMI|nr:hypothetical protein Salat_0993900 [Sesamum alatum]